MLTCRRGGRYYRVAKPEWVDPLDLSFSKVHGGRWNPPGDFGALYLGGSEEVAAANARRQHRGRAIGLFDLRPERRPVLVTVEVPEGTVLDAVTPGGCTRFDCLRLFRLVLVTSGVSRLDAGRTVRG